MVTQGRTRWRLFAPYVGLLAFAIVAWLGRASSAGPESVYLQESPPAGIHLQFTMEYTPPSSLEQQAGQLRVMGFTLSFSGPIAGALPSKVCIDGIPLMLVWDGANLTASLGADVLPSCFDVASVLPPVTLGEGEVLNRHFDSFGGALTFSPAPIRGRSHFWYPFDTLEVAAYIGVEYRLLWQDEPEKATQTRTGFTTAVDQLSVPPTAHWIGLQAEVVDAPAEFRQFGEVQGTRAWYPVDQVLRIQLRRPPLQQWVFLIVAVVMFGFVMLLSTVEKAAEFVEGGVAFFLGILSLRATLPPSRDGTITLVDFTVWALHFAFAATLASFMVGWLSARSSKATPSDHMAQVAEAEPPQPSVKPRSSKAEPEQLSHPPTQKEEGGETTIAGNESP